MILQVPFWCALPLRIDSVTSNDQTSAAETLIGPKVPRIATKPTGGVFLPGTGAWMSLTGS